MKSFFLSVALMFVSSAAFAASVKSPVDAFLASPVVGEAISELQASGYQDVSAPTMFVLSGGCGFAGCDSTYVVAVSLSTRGSNTQTTSVVALVEVAFDGKMTVKLANVLNHS